MLPNGGRVNAYRQICIGAVLPTQPPLVFLDDNAASNARAALEEFAETLTQNFAAQVEAQPEDHSSVRSRSLVASWFGGIPLG